MKNPSFPIDDDHPVSKLIAKMLDCMWGISMETVYFALINILGMLLSDLSQGDRINILKRIDQVKKDLIDFSQGQLS